MRVSLPNKATKIAQTRLMPVEDCIKSVVAPALALSLPENRALRVVCLTNLLSEHISYMSMNIITSGFSCALKRDENQNKKCPHTNPPERVWKKYTALTEHILTSVIDTQRMLSSHRYDMLKGPWWRWLVVSTGFYTRTMWNLPSSERGEGERQLFSSWNFLY